MLYYNIATCDLGHILLARNADGICSIALADNETALLAELRHHFPQAEPHSDDAQAQQWLVQVITTIENPTSAVELPLAITGTTFQQQVWQALRNQQTSEAFALYQGSFLPQSESPELEEWRHCIDAVMGKALDSCQDPSVLMEKLCKSTGGSELVRERLAELVSKPRY